MDFKIKTFEDLTTEELYEILKLRNEVFVVEQNCFYQDCDDKDKKAHHLFCEDKGQIVSYLRIYGKNPAKDEFSIGRVAVKQDYRGKGLARKMMNQAIEFIKNDLKTKTISISAQSYLIDFYETFGFTVTSKEYFDAGILHVDMMYK